MRETRLVKILQLQKDDPILQEIRAMDIDSLTPLQALSSLAEYQKRLGEKRWTGRARECDGQDQTPG